MSAEPPSSGFPAEATPPGAHRAPVRDTRPRSAFAIWTLVLTIVLGMGAMVTFLWPALIPAVLLGVVALSRIKPQRMRGQVMVIVALVMAVLVGSCSYMGAKSMHDIVEHVGTGALAALGSEEPDRIDKWIASEAREDGAAERFKKRFAAVVAAHGPYQGQAVLPTMWLGVVALSRIKPQRMRGQVMVIVALVMAVLVGSCSYMGAKSMHDIVEHVGTGALAALGSEEPDRIDKWIASEAREDGAAERFKKRFAAVVAAHGPYQGQAVLPTMWLGALPMVVPPTDVEEIAAEGDTAWSSRPGGLWFQAVFRDAVVRVELFLGDDAQGSMTKAVTDAQSQVPSPVLHDLRFFADK